MTKQGHYLDGMIFKLVAKKSFVGMSFKNSKFGECVVVDDSLGSKKLRVRFKDTGYETTATAQQFRKQKVRDRSIPIFLFGFGVNDSVGIIKGSEPKEYRLWRDMVARCYSIKKIFRNKSYENCTISSDFARYSDFASWCQDQVGFGMDNYHLDKDILSTCGKIYSKDTCCFIPRELNSLYISIQHWKQGEIKHSFCKGVYVCRITMFGKSFYLGSFKTVGEADLAYSLAKMGYIKDVCLKYEGSVDPRVIEKLKTFLE